jgi:enoyl-CoA hydratase
MSDDAPLLRHDEGRLRTITLNRPARLNALDDSLFARLDAEIALLEREPGDIGCVVLRGAGRAFCAGADIKASREAPSAMPLTAKPRILERLAELPMPVIAVVHGICFGGGLELALCADFIVAGESARFADPHGKWGYVALWGLTQRLPRRIGLPQAKRMMFTAREVGAAEALALGLADIVAADDALDAEVAALASAILANSAHTNRETKRILCATQDMPLAQGLAHESYRTPGPAPDTRERLAAFAARKAE